MCTRSSFVVILLFSFLIITTAPVFAKGPMEQIRETSDRLLAILADPSLKGSEKAAKRIKMIRETVNERFDWEEFSKRALAKHWVQRTDEEKRAFVSLFKGLLEKAYKSKVTNYFVDKVKIYYDDESIEGGYGMVKVRIVAPIYVEFPVHYRVIKKDHDWFVYDISVKGVSLVHNYRVQFREILAKSSYQELVEMLKKKLAKK